jgi:hypothetical protein
MKEIKNGVWPKVKGYTLPVVTGEVDSNEMHYEKVIVFGCWIAVCGAYAQQNSDGKYVEPLKDVLLKLSRSAIT